MDLGRSDARSALITVHSWNAPSTDDDMIANLEASDTLSNLDYLAGEIAAEDEGIAGMAQDQPLC
jgi:hypothetical protein